MTITLTERERKQLDNRCMENNGIARFIQAVRYQRGSVTKWIKPGPQTFHLPSWVMLQALRHNQDIMTELKP